MLCNKRFEKHRWHNWSSLSPTGVSNCDKKLLQSKTKEGFRKTDVITDQVQVLKMRK